MPRRSTIYDLRMALKFAIKRQELVEKILLGHGEAGNDVPVNESMPFFNTELPVHEFDPEKAAEHYKKSGHSGPIQLSVSDAAFAGAVDAGAAYCRVCQGGRNRHRTGARAQRRLLVERVEQEAMERLLLGRTSDAGLDVFLSLYGRYRMETIRPGRTPRPQRSSTIW